MEKDYYRYIDIVTKLREEYKNEEELLQELKKYIKVDNSNWQYEFEIRQKAKKGFEIINYNDSPYVILNVKEKISNLKLYNYPHSLNYKLKMNNNDLYLEDDNNIIINKDYSPNIEIINKDKFENIFNKIQKTNIYNIPELGIYINPYQDLYINYGLSLFNCEYNDDNKDYVSIDYSPKNDLLEITNNKRLSKSFIMDLIETPIPRYLFTDDYKELLDKSIEKKFIFDDYCDKKIVNYKIEEKGKELKLIPKKE